MLVSMFQMLRRTTVRRGGWELGNQILDICKSVMQNHSTITLFKPLGDILLFMADSFEDIEIRDRAHFYYRLLTHVSSEKIKIILAEPEHIDDEETGKRT